MFYLLGLALPYVHFMFLIWVVFEIFTPIMGRSGTEIPPEVVLASLVTLATIFLSSFFVSVPTNQGFCCAIDGNVYNYYAIVATFHLLGPEHEVDPDWSGLRLPHHIPGDFQRASVSLLRQSRAPTAKARLSAGLTPRKLHTSASLGVKEVNGDTAHPPHCSTPLGPSTIFRAKWKARTRVCGSTASTTRAYNTSPPTSPRSTTAFGPTAERTGPSVGSPGSCLSSSSASQ